MVFGVCYTMLFLALCFTHYQQDQTGSHFLKFHKEENVFKMQLQLKVLHRNYFYNCYNYNFYRDQISVSRRSMWGKYIEQSLRKMSNSDSDQCGIMSMVID